MAAYDNDIADRLMSDLMRDFGLTRNQASGVVGNLAWESGGFRTLQEVSPTVPGSKGGFGYAQWTGSRRRSFEAFARERGLDPRSYEANYGFMRHEIENDPYERRQFMAVKQTRTPEQAAKVVSEKYLRPGKPHLSRRVELARDISRDAQPARAAQSATMAAFAPDAGLLADTGVTRALDRMANNLPASGLPAPAARPSPPAFDPDLPPMEYSVNRSMGPLFSSMGASRRTSQAAPENMRDVLEDENQRMAGWYGLMTGKPAPAINDAIAKAGTTRERNTPDSQHFQGRALDYSNRGLTDFDKRALVEAGQLAGFGGIGLGRNITHMDTGPRRSWGYGNRDFAGFPTSEVDRAITAGTLPPGFAVTEARGAPRPAPRPDRAPPQRAPSRSPTGGLLMDVAPSTRAAPVGPVERSSLAGPNVAASYQDFGTRMSPANAAPVAPVERASLPDIQAPAPANPAAYAQMSSLPSYAALTAAPAPTPVAPAANVMAPQVLGPLAAPASMPAPAPISVPVPAAPVPAPVAQPVNAATASPAPMAPTAPAAPSGFDVWDGRSSFGIATDGSELTRMDDGNVARYSPQFDRTDISTPDGSRHVRSVQGRIDGPVGQGRVSTPSAMESMASLRSPARTNLGRAVRGGLGGVAGGMAGGLLGPVGAMLGAALGREVAANGLLARGPFGGQWTSPSMGWAAQQGAPSVDARGFPAAPPSPPGGGSNPTDFDMDHARSVSPAAAEAASRGIGGLW